ncbi:MAG: ATPase domain-containing protein [Acidobacteriaceae bacterium]
MPSATQLRARIEADLAQRIPSALTPQPKIISSVAPTGIREIDDLLQGGFPTGAITEIIGSECSGRTSLALSLVAGMTRVSKVCAWVDVSDTLHPESAAAMGVDLARLLWIRCGASPEDALPRSSVHGKLIAKKDPRFKSVLPQNVGAHPRMEINGLSTAVSDLLGSAATSHSQGEIPHKQETVIEPPDLQAPSTKFTKPSSRKKSWSRLEQGLRAADLLLHAGGFSCIVVDLGSLAPEYALRVPLATWFRFRAAAERLQSNVLLLTQHACSRNSAGLVLRLAHTSVIDDKTILAGLEHRAELTRQRFVPDNVFSLRKPPQNVSSTTWQAKTPWVGERSGQR